VGVPAAAARAAAEAGGGGATVIRWVAAALAIAGWQATTKRVADGAINNQPLHEEEEDLATAATEGEAGGGGATATFWGATRGGTGGRCRGDCLAMTSLACTTTPVASKLKTMTTVAVTIAGQQAMTMRAADGAINNQLLHEEEADHTSWLTPAFLVISKMTTRIFLESLSPILHPLSFFIFSPAYFASSQFFHPLNT
jgi:hypothetical protein